jgi:cephalosporin hydroxylase
MENSDFFNGYHQWYYNSNVWKTTTFMGIECQKSVSDMWNYQEIIYNLRPSLIVEGGTAYGGSALYFSFILKSISPISKILSVDIDHSRVTEPIRTDSHIELLTGKITDEDTISRIKELRTIFKGPLFIILDDDHSKNNVLAEMKAIREILVTGDYLVVEDSNINGHPVLPSWGEGPMEAIDEYFQIYPHDYNRDIIREEKFGFTFAPKGFLIRN